MFECVLRPGLASNHHGFYWFLIPMSKDYEFDDSTELDGWEPSLKRAIAAAKKTAGRGNISFYRIGRRENASQG